MAHRSLRGRIAGGVTHLCALAALAYAGRAAAACRGWLRVPRIAADAAAPSLSIVVPARNEAHTIERCVRSLLAQRLPDFEVIVVDDGSVDDTAAIVAALAETDSRLRPVAGAPLPAGWVGKPWALVQGARIARGEWLLFTDADSTHAPDASASTLAFAAACGADALSLATYQELGSWGERAVLPSILGLILVASGSIAALNDPHDRDHALANGQYLLVSRAAYDALGGHAALRAEIAEDVAFARRLKADGRFRLVLAGGEDVVRVRMYASLAELWAGFRKNMYVGAGGNLYALFGAAAFLAALSVVPAALALEAVVRRRPLPALEAVLVLGLGMAVEANGLRTVRLPRRLAWYAPIGYAICGAILVDSTLHVLSGRGVTWRGRRYTGRVDAERP